MNWPPWKYVSSRKLKKNVAPTYTIIVNARAINTYEEYMEYPNMNITFTYKKNFDFLDDV